ncbi:phosphotransferase family protein [Roseisolibacter sp. H3M3-2]|uniref:phosphotransferase family protein n=1 Tax=Roseisolibacter sp. H3M3-2 TaxID=3031323 RepID=UPI0023DBE229|nr:phosphotransferase family protein [Roseisolibacter sp. H3M3-2]MDF1504796.1 phosphotransferase family protein [Roseisolibacter sp. H3M3-2]
MREDAPRAVRAGEELDVAALAGFLARAVPGWADVDAGALSVAQFGSGFSNLTYLVRAGDRELVLRRPPRGVHAGSAHDVLREARLLRAVRPAYPRVPEVLALGDDASLLGAPFYCMTRVRGVILRGLPGEPVPDAAAMRRLSERFVDELAALHALDWRAAGLAELGRPDGYVERQVAGWGRRWLAARAGDVASVDCAAAWLEAHRPPERGAALIHNDFKYDNLVLDPADPSRVAAVLDWEMATLGDPLMDLGTSLGYWADPDDPPELRALGLGLTAAPGNLSRAELVARYASITRRDVGAGDALFYYVFGLFKLAVVAQQIHARYVAGHTRDPRFAALDASVRTLGALAGRAVALGRIDRLG